MTRWIVLLCVCLCVTSATFNNYQQISSYEEHSFLDPEDTLSVSVPLELPQRPLLGSTLVLPCYFQVVPYSVCPVFDGESLFIHSLREHTALFIKILVNQCPESEISFRTQRKGSVFTYDKEKDMCTVEPRYRDRIQMKNYSNGRIFEFRNVTKEDMDEIYVIYASNTPHQRFVITIKGLSGSTCDSGF
ncbi:unnamed protein product [Coregonus sp. 'balchen']|nr:unnamed protein product [Coregonus sp. 'balchen']